MEYISNSERVLNLLKAKTHFRTYTFFFFSFFLFYLRRWPLFNFYTVKPASSPSYSVLWFKALWIICLL